MKRARSHVPPGITGSAERTLASLVRTVANSVRALCRQQVCEHQAEGAALASAMGMGSIPWCGQCPSGGTRLATEPHDHG